MTLQDTLVALEHHHVTQIRCRTARGSTVAITLELTPCGAEFYRLEDGAGVVSYHTDETTLWNDLLWRHQVNADDVDYTLRPVAKVLDSGPI